MEQLWKRHKHILLLSGISILLVGTITLGIYTLRVDKKVEYCIAQHNRLVDYLSIFFEKAQVPEITETYDDDIRSVHTINSTDAQKDSEHDPGNVVECDEDPDETVPPDPMEQSEDESSQHTEDDEDEACALDTSLGDTVEVHVV